MRRILLMLTVVVLMVAMLAANSAPVFAKDRAPDWDDDTGGLIGDIL
jgi:hypothetical protein